VNDDNTCFFVFVALALGLGLGLGLGLIWNIRVSLFLVMVHREEPWGWALRRWMLE